MAHSGMVEGVAEGRMEAPVDTSAGEAAVLEVQTPPFGR